MKKIVVLISLVLSVGFIMTGCSSDSNSVENVDTMENVDLVEEMDDATQEIDDEVVDRDEYSYNVSMVGGERNMNMNIYKKGSNSLMEIISMDVPEEETMPFEMKKSLFVNGQSYQQIGKDGETYRFSTPGEEGTMFNLKEMSTIDKALVKDTKEEKINGEKMTCYYVNDEIEGNGKVCLNDGIFMYGEFDNMGISNTIEITDYDDSVKDRVFDLPSEDEILSTQDMMKLFQ